MGGDPKGQGRSRALLALDASEQGRQHGLDLHRGARAHDGLPLVLQQLRHVLRGRGGGRHTGEAVQPGHRLPQVTRAPRPRPGREPHPPSFRPQLAKVRL